MKIYNEDKTMELTRENCDLKRGYLKHCTETIYHEAVEAIQEEGYYKIICEYPNGGRDVEWVTVSPGQDAKKAWEENIEYEIYIPYSEQEIKIIDLEGFIEDLKTQLNNSDYLAIKYAEGLLSQEEYEPIKNLRQSFRQQINLYEDAIKNLKLSEEEDNEALL